jgi:ABC-type transport system involved in multi-copper enzyme maturation permease subunit
MGQQQLLLIVLGVIIVGIAIVVGINLFNANSVSANRDGITSDLNNLAAIAHQYYIKPTAMGGGGQSFLNFTMDGNAKQLESNANGTYTITTAGTGTSIEFDGKGTQIGNDGSQPVEMKILVRVPPLNDSLYVVN